MRALVAQTLRGSLAWLPLREPFRIASYTAFLDRLAHAQPGVRHVLLHGIDPNHAALAVWLRAHEGWSLHPIPAAPGPARNATAATDLPSDNPQTAHRSPMKLTHLQRLEAESIHIMREVVAEAENPVMLYSIGKDSATMLHIARKAFHPARPPFPLLHVDTTWKFRDMYALRDRMAKESGMDLLVYQNPEAAEKGINPFTHGSQIHTDLWKTQGLRQALDKYGFDAAFGGARRDEEKSRAKERIFSFRSAQHRWDPKNQRPELWNLYNARKHKGESIRVFPLSNWTELDIWQYIYLENVPIVPLYFARERPVVERDGTLIMVDDERMPLRPGEVPVMRKVRFRTLGCYPLTGAVESEAETLPEVIQEMLLTRTSERQGRMIDHDTAASMEKKKQEGYF
ncbi:MAG: sulfate adenylyltransferase subunit CysD [Steroidobacteraceae bacterium]